MKMTLKIFLKQKVRSILRVIQGKTVKRKTDRIKKGMGGI